MATALCVATPGGAQTLPAHEVHAVRYATLPGFPVRGLIAGADTARRLDIAMAVWLVRGGGRVVLIDAGFYRQKFLDRWKPADYVKPSEAVARAGVAPEDVTDIIISHIHWDHADGADLFPNARVWIQKEEYDHHVGPDGEVRDRAVDPDVARMFATLKARGRLEEIAGDSTEIIPGITVFTGGKHTYGSQYASVRTPAGMVVIASDNLYLYENLDRRRPIAQTLDSLSNLRAHERMTKLASAPRFIVPGHDPAVFVRFPTPGNGVARIR
ncbi:MAG TPA: N-acyl homoserine lactonase family protein [Gemmatimonadaceae bacterium]|nr:N-acyl homoserine lactonase family protein [Gemmatimonadaceae bacterium]